MPPVVVAVGIGILAGMATASIALGAAAAVAYYALTEALTPDTKSFDASPTYRSDAVGNTITEGVVVARCYGKCKIGGNKIRFSPEKDKDAVGPCALLAGIDAVECLLWLEDQDNYYKYKDPDVVDIIVAHCQGVVEGIETWYVNDIEWSELDNVAKHSKTEYKGSRTQIIDERFPTELRGSPYRGIAYTAVSLWTQDTQVGYDPKVVVVMNGMRCKGTWNGLADAFGGNARYGAVITACNEKLYGGLGFFDKKDWWEYDPVTDQWTQKTDYPDAGGQRYAVAVEVDGKIYAGMGSDTVEWHEYDPSTNTWTQKANYPGGNAFGMVAVATDDKIFVGLDLNKDWYEYTPSTDTWVQKADYGGSSIRHAFGGFCSNGKIYVGTGSVGMSLVSEWYEYDISTDTWTQKTDFAGGERYGIATVTIGNDIYAYGGYSFYEQPRDCWKYDAINDEWVEDFDYKGSYFFYGVAAAIDETIYIGTGTNGVTSSDQWWELATSSFTRNNAVVLMDWYLNVENCDCTMLNYEAFESLEKYCDEVPTSGELPRYRFDFIFDTDSSINDSKKVLFASFNGRVIKSQGKLKPVWDSDQMSDGDGALTTKTVSHAFTEDNIKKDSFSWNQPERPNVVRIHYIDSMKKYQKTSCEIKDEYDIEINGEILHEEKCWWITDSEIAHRRCQFKFNKFLYSDYNVKLEAFSDSSDLEIYDLVTVTHSLPGWTAKEFTVVHKSEDMFGAMQFGLEAYYAGIYSDEQVSFQPGYGTEVQNKFEAIGGVIYAKSYDDANLSGTPKIVKFQNQPGGTSYYIKTYPTLSGTIGGTSDDMGQDLHALDETDLSGTPKIFKFNSNGIVYYIKAYPTISSETVSCVGITITPRMLKDADLSGTARVAVFNICGVEYYFKIYPVRS